MIYYFGQHMPSRNARDDFLSLVLHLRIFSRRPSNLICNFAFFNRHLEVNLAMSDYDGQVLPSRIVLHVLLPSSHLLFTIVILLLLICFFFLYRHPYS